MQFTIVSAVPLTSATAFCATSVEKSGESAITTMPQRIKNMENTLGALIFIIKGVKRQQIPERVNAKVATFFSPQLLER